MYCKKNYYCNSDKIIVVINLQKSNFDNSYYINYGFCVKDIHNDLQYPKNNECDITGRFLTVFLQRMKRKANAVQSFFRRSEYSAVFQRQYFCNEVTMDISVVIKIAAVGIIVAVLNAILVRSGRDDYALITILAGIVAVLMMLLPQFSDLLSTVERLMDI